VLLERLSRFGALAPDAPWRADHTVQLELPPAPQSPAQARRAVREACERWGIPALADAAALAVSELVTNAVLHAGTPILVMVEHDGGNLTVAVGDGEAALPRLRPPSADEESGRGVAIVDRLGATWGCNAPCWARRCGSASSADHTWATTQPSAATHGRPVGHTG
jgi:anti-sigma regulatory factor (Ser/Thr protein kinase)